MRTVHMQMALMEKIRTPCMEQVKPNPWATTCAGEHAYWQAFRRNHMGDVLGFLWKENYHHQQSWADTCSTLHDTLSTRLYAGLPCRNYHPKILWTTLQRGAASPIVNLTSGLEKLVETAAGNKASRHCHVTAWSGAWEVTSLPTAGLIGSLMYLK